MVGEEYDCKICGRKFNSDKEAKLHIRKEHNLLFKDYYDKYLKQPDEGICRMCGKPAKFRYKFVDAYSDYCSVACEKADLNYPEHRHQRYLRTIQRNYGVSNTFQLQSTKDKIKKTNLEKYGHECVLNNPEIKKKQEATNLKKYGCRVACQAESVKKKIAMTNLKKYGVENVFGNNEIKEKIRKTNIDRYGAVTYGCSATGIQKVKKTNLEKYGAENIFASDYGKAKVKSTMLKKYGVENISSAKLDIVRDYCKNNHFLLCKDLTDQYGHGWYMYLSLPIEKYKGCDILDAKYLDNVKTYYDTHTYACSSVFEKDVLAFIKSIYSLPIVENSRAVISPLELDIYIPDKHIAIECNGSYWHSDLFKPANYHELKSKRCEDVGIRLIHIYDWEWSTKQEQIKELLRIALGCTKTRIYARQCEIRVISNKEARPFNDANHLQGHRNAQITYGLFYDNELVQLMSFSKTKYNRNNKGVHDWEIIRGCPGSNNIVVGGVSKLLSHFIDDNHPDKIFSYCDFNKFDGKSYLESGMSFIGYTGPNKWWLLKDGCVVNRSPNNYTELKKEAKATIWGSGSKKFELVLSK